MPFDPFAPKPEPEPEPDEAQTEIETAQEAPAAHSSNTKEKPTMATDSLSGRMTVTFKGHGGFDSPWIVIYAEDAEDALSQVKDPKLFELIEATKLVGEGWSNLYGSSAKPAARQGNSTARQSSDRKPPVATERPSDVPAEYCAHGERVYATGPRKDGTGMWRALDCPDKVCDRSWINDRKK